MAKIGFIGGKFLPLHQGHIFAALTARNLVDKLYIILSSSEKRDAELCDRDGIKHMPGDVRMSWLSQTFNGLENVEIINIKDDQGDEDYNWEDGARMITNAIPEKITHIFSSEQEYTQIFEKLYPFTKHVVVDEHRHTIPISATELRKNLYSHWYKLPSIVRSHFVKKVLITGTESVGKSTLTTELAKFFNTNFAHEIGRDYCEKYQNHLTVPMFNSIAMKHFILQEELAPTSNKVLLVDSDAMVTKYYLEMYFNKTSKLIDEVIALQQYDLCLYLEPDVNWVPDGFRFSGGNEERIINNKRLKLMYGHSMPKLNYVPIEGGYSTRLFKARQEINQLF